MFRAHHEEKETLGQELSLVIQVFTDECPFCSALITYNFPEFTDPRKEAP